MDFITYPLVIAVVVLLLSKTVFTVKQKTAVVIERLGKFQRIAQSGLQFKIPFIDQKAGAVNLRVRELPVDIETKTKDDVFVNLIVSVQYYVTDNPEGILDALAEIADQTIDYTSKQTAETTVHRIKSTLNSNT